MSDGAEGPSPHDNDADSKPYIRKTITSKHSQVEVVVEGAEGEKTDDIKDVATEQFDEAVKAQSNVRKSDKEPNKRGCQ